MKINMLTILDETRVKNKVLCRCDCGKEKWIIIYNVKSGTTKSCGCFKKKNMQEEAKKRFTGKQPANFEDYSGKKIGMVTVLKRIEDKSKWSTTYLCECECGTKKEIQITNLRREKYKYCKCGRDNHPLKRVLRSMIDRCENSKNDHYKYYGGKGIKVCEEWRKYPIKFIKWSEKNGWEKKVYKQRKDALSIDRINSSDDYCPENCQWIALSENSRKASEERWKHS